MKIGVPRIDRKSNPELNVGMPTGGFKPAAVTIFLGHTFSGIIFLHNYGNANVLALFSFLCFFFTGKHTNILENIF